MTTPLNYMKDHIQVLQSELDKANARIAQLEDALQIAHKYMNHLPTFGEDRVLVIKALKGSSDTWLSQHDKAVEVKVLEDVYSIANDQADVNLNIYASKFLSALTVMIESRK